MQRLVPLFLGQIPFLLMARYETWLTESFEGLEIEQSDKIGAPLSGGEPGERNVVVRVLGGRKSDAKVGVCGLLRGRAWEVRF